MNVVFVLSDVGFQQAVWVAGNHPKHYVSSYEETFEMFHENLDWLIDDDLWKKVRLTDAQIGALRSLYAKLDEFDNGKRGRDPAEINGDPGWGAIVELAGKTLTELHENGCGVRPEYRVVMSDTWERKALSDAQQKLLVRAVEAFAPQLIPLLLDDVIRLPLCRRNQLRSALGSLLSAEGFDADWSLTPAGREIEHLIDVLGPK